MTRAPRRGKRKIGTDTPREEIQTTAFNPPAPGQESQRPSHCHPTSSAHRIALRKRAHTERSEEAGTAASPQNTGGLASQRHRLRRPPVDKTDVSSHRRPEAGDAPGTQKQQVPPRPAAGRGGGRPGSSLTDYTRISPHGRSLTRNDAIGGPATAGEQFLLLYGIPGFHTRAGTLSAQNTH